MTDPSLDREQIEALLREADCPEEFTRQFLAALETAPPEEQLRLLRCQRCRQLDRLRDEKKKLEELDYLRYRLERPRRKREEGGARND